MPIPSGEGHYQAKRSGLTDDKVRAIRQRLAAGERNCDLAAEFKISRVMVTHISQRTKWAHVPDEGPVPPTAAEERIIRALCRERCAEVGEPPCWEISPHDWRPEDCDCDCAALGAVAARAARAA